MNRTVPTVDISLLLKNKTQLIDEIRHALLEFGQFYLDGYDEFIDSNIIRLLLSNSTKAFNNSIDVKEQVTIINSKHFLGYSNISSNDLNSNELFIIGSKHIENDNIMGNNQFLDGSDSLKKLIENTFEKMHYLSFTIIELIIESLGLKTGITDKLISKKADDNYAKLKLVNTPSKLKLSALISHHGLSTSQQENSKPFRLHDFITLIFNPNSMEVQDIYGNWNGLPHSPPNSLLVCSGDLLELLTSGAYISSHYRIITPTKSAQSIEYTPVINLDYDLTKFRLTNSKLIVNKTERDKLRPSHLLFNNKDIRCTTYRELYLNYLMNAFQAVTKIHYPEQYKLIQQKQSENKDVNSTSQLHLLEKVSRLKTIFSSINKTLLLKFNRTSNIKIKEIISDLRNLSQLELHIEQILQIYTIDSSFIPILIDKNGDYVLDIDFLKSNLSLKNLTKISSEFNAKADEWFEANKNDLLDIPILLKKDFKSVDGGNDGNDNIKRRKLLSSNTELNNVLKNPKKQFDIKLKTPIFEQKKTGLTLLQRIKLKEEQNLISPPLSVAKKKELFVKGKLSHALNIICQLKPNNSVPIKKLSELLSNSLVSTPVSETEANNVFLKLTSLFPNEFKVVNYKNEVIIKWATLNRNTMLQEINEKLSI